MADPREVPLLFSAPMVQAILAGLKTQTRRLAKPRRRVSLLALEDGQPMWSDSYITDPGNLDWLLDDAAMRPGDGLWVKENYRFEAMWNSAKPSLVNPGTLVWYEASENPTGWKAAPASVGRLRPSIHMPRWASRINLRCTDVRVERLNDCSEADAIAEGVHRIWPEGSASATGPNFFTVNVGFGSLNAPTAVGTYKMLWEMINGEGSWEANPLIWVYTFERLP